MIASVLAALAATNLAVGVWYASLCSVLFAWVLAALVCRPGEAPRTAAAARLLGPAAVVGLVVLGLMRLLDLALQSVNGGPLGWWRDWLGVASLTARPVLVLSAFVAPLALPVGVVIGAALLGPAPKRHGTPGGWALAALLAVGGLALPLLSLNPPYASASADPVLLDLVGAGPALLLALAAWASSRWEPAVEAPRAAAGELPPPAPGAVDLAETWRRLGLIAPQAEPLTARPAEASPPPGQGLAAACWGKVGAAGAPPTALTALFDGVEAHGQGLILSDLPDQAEELLLAALTLGAVRRRGHSALLVSDAPEGLLSALGDGLAREGGWGAGVVVRGETALRESLGGGRLPELTTLSLTELSAHGVRALSAPQPGGGAPWAQGLSLILLSRLDRGAPLEVTHRLLTLRRLGLALNAAGARYSIVATGLGGPASRALLERAFPGLNTKELPIGAKPTTHLRVWVAQPQALGAPGLPWARRAITPAADAGLQTSVGDPHGEFDQRGVEPPGGQTTLRRGLALDGACSASALSEAWLIAAWRALPHRAARQGDPPSHDALWGVPQGPVSRFLLSDNNLLGLERSGRLPAPRPLAGLNNPALNRAHLRAALREGAPDLESLYGLFGRSLVERELGDARSDRFALRRDGVSGALRRVRLAPSPTESVPDPVRATVTSQVVRVVDQNGGRLLVEEDRAIVLTRYYPKRVFAVGAQRYLVPLQAFDEKRGELLVAPCAVTEPLTRPVLEIQLDGLVLVESVHELRDDTLHLRLGSYEATILETVSGLRAADGSSLRYEPVHAQYRSRVRGVFLRDGGAPGALSHLAASLDDALRALVFASDEDVEVIPIAAGTILGMPAGLCVVDRHVQGVGVAEALDTTLTAEALRWVRAILQRCPCSHGCERCTPREVLERGPDKGGVLRLLGA
ncbi:MAG: DUF1998 domain-containing protein [Deltaproteobacteria bacterium]|nr:DUF1998 domain-containing protein [Deltaproteobacteria bacterium]